MREQWLGNVSTLHILLLAKINRRLAERLYRETQQTQNITKNRRL
jgi:hypothetical protein